MTTSKKLTRNINGVTFYCEALRGTKQDAEKSKRSHKEAFGCKVRIFPVTTEGVKMYGVFVSAGYSYTKM